MVKLGRMALTTAGGLSLVACGSDGDHDSGHRLTLVPAGDPWALDRGACR